jgi:predicted Zn-dependent protease
MTNFSYGQDGRRSSGGLGMRVIIAGFILISGFCTYYCSTQTNPVTHESQHIRISPDQEVQLGLQAAPEMAAQMGGELPANDPREVEVKSMGQKLVGALPENPYSFQFHLLADPQTVNAFALPGGQVFITEALYDKLTTEGELAGVLGHEVGHVIHRHSAEQMAHADFYNSIVTAAGVASNDSRAAALANYVAQLRSLKFSRTDELEADQWGLEVMTRAGYDPREMLRVMDVLKALEKNGGGSEMMSTHPLAASRIDRINDYLAEHFPHGIPAALTPGGPIPHPGGARGGLRFLD